MASRRSSKPKLQPQKPAPRWTPPPSWRIGPSMYVSPSIRRMDPSTARVEVCLAAHLSAMDRLHPRRTQSMVYSMCLLDSRRRDTEYVIVSFLNTGVTAIGLLREFPTLLQRAIGAHRPDMN